MLAPEFRSDKMTLNPFYPAARQSEVAYSNNLGHKFTVAFAPIDRPVFARGRYSGREVGRDAMGKA